MKLVKIFTSFNWEPSNKGRQKRRNFGGGSRSDAKKERKERRKKKGRKKRGKKGRGREGEGGLGLEYVCVGIR